MIITDSDLPYNPISLAYKRRGRGYQREHIIIHLEHMTYSYYPSKDLNLCLKPSCPSLFLSFSTPVSTQYKSIVINHTIVIL
jgi:hypothetical protein